MKRRRPRTFAMALTAALVAGVASSACLGDNPQLEYKFPSEADFTDKGVSLFMERRCGTMDCHGQVARPLRIYSQYGLRKEPTNNRQQTETTDDERRANYAAVTGLEPEELTRAVETKGNYIDFMLFKKPLDEVGGGVKHKGGPVLRGLPNDNGWTCLLSWVSGKTNAEACGKAAEALDQP